MSQGWSFAVAAAALAQLIWVVLYYTYRCDHAWEVRGVREMYQCTKYAGVRIGEIEDGVPKTEVLSVCARCGRSKTETLTGHWTFDEIKPEGKENDQRNT
jgi:hypothetical protein